VIYELGGRRALDRLMEQVEALDAPTRTLAARGLHLGIVIDEQREEFGPGDFLIRAVLGADREAGAVAVGQEVAVGTTVQFHVRDAVSADAELRRMLDGREADGALVFTCSGRGAQLFGEPHHDATVLSESLDAAPLAGMFCAGELGPIGGETFVHAFTASVALFT